MPRLRRIKDRDWTPTDEDFPEALSNTSDGQKSSSEGNAYEGYEATTGESWLSNATIVASIPDEKLRSTLVRYRSLVKLLETEVVTRGLASRKTPRRNGPLDVQTTGRNARRSYDATSIRKKANPLTSEQMLKALEILCKLTKDTNLPPRNESEL